MGKKRLSLLYSGGLPREGELAAIGWLGQKVQTGSEGYPTGKDPNTEFSGLLFQMGKQAQPVKRLPCLIRQLETASICPVTLLL